MPIDFSKINLSRLPKGGNAVKAPSRVMKAPPKEGRIDYGAIKLGNIYTPTKGATPVAIPVRQAAVGSTSFTGRPLVTPVEQQRMKMAAPKPTPPAVSKLTGKYDPQKYNPEVTPVAPLLQTETVKRWSAEAVAARKATPDIGQRLVDGMNSFTKIIQPNITPSDPGRNTVADFAGSIATVAAGVYAVKSLLSAIGAGVLYLKTPRTVVDRETTTLFPRFDNSHQAQEYVLRLQKTDPAAAEKFKNDLITLLAQTMEKDMPSNIGRIMENGKMVTHVTSISEKTLQETASRMYDFLVSNGQAGSFASVGERFASATTAASNLGAAVGNPQMSLAVATQATNQLAKTGMLQLLPPLVVSNRLGAIPMPAGLVHSTAPAIPMGGKTQPALPQTSPSIAISQPQVSPTTPETVIAPVVAPAVVTRPVQAPAVKSYADIMAKEEAMGAALNTTPRAVDKTIPAIDITKANLVDVTAKVDLPSVQVKFPSADKVVLDTKRRVVMFMHGTTPLEAIGIDKPQLETWYGIEGAKLLGEITRPVVAQISPPAPPLSKMETPAVKEPWEMTKAEFAKAYPMKKSPYSNKGFRNELITDKAYSNPTGGLISARKEVIQKALAEGQPVPPEVLAEYPDLSTTPQKGTATTISNQKTGISTSTPVSPRVGTPTGAGAVVPVVNGKRVTFKASNGAELVGNIISIPELSDFAIAAVKVETGGWHAHELTSGYSLMTDSMGIVKTKKALGELIVRQLNKGIKWGESSPADTLLRMVSPTKIVNPEYSRPTAVAYGEVATPASVPAATLPAGIYVQPTTTAVPQRGMKLADTKTSITYTIDTVVRPKGGQVAWVEASDRHGNNIKVDGAMIGERYVLEAPTAPITSTSTPVGAPSIGNATPAHGLIDYSRIELNGTTSQTSPKVLASVGNAGKRSRVETEGFDNFLHNTPGTTNTPHSLVAKFKEGRDAFFRFISNEYNWFFKSPLGGEWMTIAVAADDLMLEEYKNPFYITEAGEQVFVGGEFGPAILARYLKQFGAVKNRYLQDLNGIDLVDSNGKKISNPNYGKADFGIFLQHLQRAGIPIEATKGLGADKTNLAQQHIWDARDKIVNFQKNDPQLFKAYMAAAQELGEANKLLAEFYKGIISPETYANDKANPHYYVSLSAGKTDIFDRSGVAPLERAHGLTNLDEVVAPLQGLLDVYVTAIRAQGINRAKIEMVKWNKNSGVATTVLSDSIVHLWENGVDRAYEVHDKDAGASIRNLTREKWEVPSWIKRVLTAPTTLLRVFATGVNIAFGTFNPVRDIIQAAGLVPFTPKGLVRGTVQAFKSPGLSQWSKDYRDPTRPTGTKVTEAVKKIVELVSIPSNVGESLSRDVIAESIGDRGGTYLDQFYGYHAGTGFFALHGTVFNDFISSLVPFTRATIAVVRAAYRNAFYGLPIGGKGGTFSGKQGAEKILGKNFLATIIFAMIEIAAIKAAGKEKEYKLLRNRASFFYLYQPSGNWVKLPVPIGSAPIKAIVESLYGFESDPMDVARQTLNVIPGLEAFMLPPALTTYLQYKFNINFFTGSPINTGADTPAKNPLEAAIMKLGYTEEEADLALRSFFADIPSQFQYVFDIVATGSSTQAFPLTKRFIVKDPTTSSNAAVDDFYALVDAAKLSKNPALESFVNARANAVGDLLHNAKLYPENAKTYIAGATDFIIATFALIAENPSVYGIKKFGPHSWRPSGNYEELAP